MENKINHKNFNGLICSAEYYAENPEVIHELIDKWFAHTDLFLRKLKMISSPGLSETKSHISFTIPRLLAFLKEHTDSENISDKQVGNVYHDDYNHFYKNPDEAFGEFYDKALENSTFIENYIEIAKIQLASDKFSDEELKKVLFDIKEQMVNIFTTK